LKEENGYIVDLNGLGTIVENSNCFIGSSIKKVEKWLKDNTDFDTRENEWWWVIIKIYLNDEDGGEYFKAYDWDANELEDFYVIQK
jgi:hypothetical protein